MNNLKLEEIIEKLKEAFKKEEVKKTILDKKWLKRNLESWIDSTWFCFYSSFTIYKLAWGSDIWNIMYLSERVFSEWWHCYLINKNLLDITSD